MKFLKYLIEFPDLLRQRLSVLNLLLSLDLCQHLDRQLHHPLRLLLVLLFEQ
jgi:hypothetical protein